MVARITAGSPRHAAVHGDAEAIVSAADALRGRFEAARVIDEEAYGRVVAASALPKATDAQKGARTAALQAALVQAAEEPLVAAGLATEGLELARRTAALGNAHLISDVECAQHFFRAARAASAANVRINHQYIKNDEVVRQQAERLAAICSID
jgi:formiminotetrahydrofolate cyclodeaminase